MTAEDQAHLRTNSAIELSPACDLSIVLPAHNEVEILGSTVTNLVTGLSSRELSYEILIVENGSTDGTLRLARTLAAQIDPVRVLSLPNDDYGAALRAGFLAATGVLVVNFDVDYYDLSFLDASLELIAQGSALVLASKRAPGAHDQRSLLRRGLTAGFAATLRHVLDLQVSDAHGMKAMKRAALHPIVEICKLNGSVFDVEMVLRAIQCDLDISEIPATVIEFRPPRTSVVNRTIETLAGVVRLRFILRQERRQGH